jgi:hypothetical protein
VAFEPSAFRQHRCGQSQDRPHPLDAQILKRQRGLTVNQVPSGSAGSSPALCTNTTSVRSSTCAASAQTWGSIPVGRANPARESLGKLISQRRVEAAERQARYLLQSPVSCIRGVQTLSLACVHAQAGGSGPQGQAQLGHTQRLQISFAKRLSLVGGRGAPPFPDLSTGGKPVVQGRAAAWAQAAMKIELRDLAGTGTHRNGALNKAAFLPASRRGVD